MAKKMKVRRFAGGDSTSFSEDLAGAPERKLPGQTDYERTADVEKAANAPKKQTFSEAFAEARKKALAGGPKTFTWNGGSYGTKLAGEDKRAPVRSTPTRSTPSSSSSSSSSSTPMRSTTPAPTPRAAAPKAAAPKPQVKGDYKSGAQMLSDWWGSKMSELKKASAPARAEEAKRNAERSKKAASDTAPKAAPKAAPKRASIADFLKPPVMERAKSEAKPTRSLTQKLEKPAEKSLLLKRAKGGKVAKYVKGGSVRSVDGIAIRGKTRAPMKKGK